MLQYIGKEVKKLIQVEPKLKPLSFTSIIDVLSKIHHEGVMVSFRCQGGGGGIIPIGSSNIDLHQKAIQEHLNHGDKMEVSFWSERPLVNDSEVWGFDPVVAKYKLVA